MKLYGSLTSPFVRKIRIQLLEKAIAYEWVPEDVWSASTEIRTINPLGKVPCLVLEGGVSVYDSAVIAEALESLYPTSALLPTQPIERIRARTLEALGDGVSEAAVAMLLEARFHEGDKKSQPWIDRHIAKIMVGGAQLERDLQAQCKPGADSSSSSGLLGNYGLGDIAVGAAFLYVDFRFPEIPWRAEFPLLATFIDSLNQRESFAATRPPR